MFGNKDTQKKGWVYVFWTIGGDLRALRNLRMPKNAPTTAAVASNPIRNLKYHFIPSGFFAHLPFLHSYRVPHWASATHASLSTHTPFTQVFGAMHSVAQVTFLLKLQSCLNSASFNTPSVVKLID
jgi:hypothetical protein